MARRRRYSSTALIGIALACNLSSPASGFSCPAKQVLVQPGHAKAGTAITIEGSGWFSGPCDDTYEGPEKGIEVSFVQGGRSWLLGTVDASSKPGARYNGFRMSSRVPMDVSPGDAFIVANGPTKSARKGFRVLAARLPETGVSSDLFLMGWALLAAAAVWLRLGRRARITPL